MAVEFRILGEIEARADGRILDLGHTRQRCVLVGLLVDVNRVVQTDQLIDRVWADEPPHRARNALAAYISRLRQILPPDVPIVREGGGYVLRADPQSVDLHRFRRLVSTARAGSDSSVAARLFDEAIELWNGAPLPTLDTPWINEVRTSIEAEHLSALLDRNDAALDAGRHAPLLVGLASLHSAHPLDERVAGQLMLAQYRCGRQADAIEVYLSIRTRLVDQLGVDPGPALRAVYGRILDGDPGREKSREPMTSPPTAAVSATASGVSRRVTRLVGRGDDVARVLTSLADGPLTTLTGVGGVGKTRLALEVADRAASRFADGAVVCELAPLSDGSGVAQAVVASLRVTLRHASLEQSVIDEIHARSLLFVVDNCEHVLADIAAFVDLIVRHCPGVTVLATSREPLGVEGERVLPVPPLSESDAAELFSVRAKASRPSFDPALEPVGAVAEICRRLDGVPLAIELAAARMRAMSSLDVARRLDRLRLLSGGTRGAHPRQQSVTATIDWSYQLLDDAEKRLFTALSVFAGGFDLEAAHAICADESATEDDTLDLLTGLVDKSMVVVKGADTGATRYGVLETLRAYGRDRLRDNGMDCRIASRHTRYFVELIERAAAGSRGPDEPYWVQRMAPSAGTTYTAPDFDNLRVAFDCAIGDHDDDLVLRLVTSLAELVHVRVGYHSFDWVQRAVDFADPDHPLFPAAIGTAARGTLILGDIPRALAMVERALGRSPEPDAPGLVYPGDILADVARYRGDVRTALAHYETERTKPRADEPQQLVWILYNVTLCHQSSGVPEIALPAGREAVEVADRTGNPSLRAMARTALGRSLALCDPASALMGFGEAHELAAAVENNWFTGMARMESAAIHALSDDPASAAPMFIEVLDHWGRAGPNPILQQWETMIYIAPLLERLGAADEALRLRHAIAAAGWQAPTNAAAAPRLSGAGVLGDGGLDVVESARTALARFT